MLNQTQKISTDYRWLKLIGLVATAGAICVASSMLFIKNREQYSNAMWATVGFLSLGFSFIYTARQLTQSAKRRIKVQKDEETISAIEAFVQRMKSGDKLLNSFFVERLFLDYDRGMAELKNGQIDTIFGILLIILKNVKGTQYESIVQNLIDKVKEM